ncbi:hypothetical protein AMI01nite_59260 [Aneurinibacillus migulanus]|nr:hypothetical protein AMI01nite_59260 [Aneurinibacillus migulanus]
MNPKNKNKRNLLVVNKFSFNKCFSVKNEYGYMTKIDVIIPGT